MDWSHIPYALEKGVMISLNPDATALARSIISAGVYRQHGKWVDEGDDMECDGGGSGEGMVESQG